MAKRRKGTKKTAQSTATDKSLSAEPVKKAILSLSIVSAKLCRLCGSKEGPFLNIFDADKVASKKIDDLLPFVIAENDDLPHKICFRCSAKVEELHEFVQKCIRTQENFCNSLGKKTTSIITKPKTHRLLWEEKLNKSNITNDDICDAVVKKAMEGIKDLSFKPLVEKATIVEKPIEVENKEHSKDTETEKDLSDAENKQQKEAEKTLKRASRSCTNKTLLSGLEVFEKKVKTVNPTETNKVVSDTPPKVEKKVGDVNKKRDTQEDQTKNHKNETEEKIEIKEKKPFFIMEHVKIITVTGVGLLYLCKLCNRNFLKKDVLLSHWCAKNGTAKEDFTRKTTPAPVSNNPPKTTTVKYINSSVNNDSKKLAMLDSGKQSQKKAETSDITLKEVSKPKPRIGPASKVKRRNDDSTPEPTHAVESVNKNPESLVQMPAVRNLKSHYKLVPGPNNTLVLVEATISQDDNQEFNVKRPIKVEKEDEPDPKPQPYPVGLIQTMPQQPGPPEIPRIPAPFEITAEEKQSYQIIRTSNPNKLLISAKVKSGQTEPLPKKQKITSDTTPKQKYSITPEDKSFFTFVNVDPLLQPSYDIPVSLEAQEPTVTAVTTKQLKKTDKAVRKRGRKN